MALTNAASDRAYLLDIDRDLAGVLTGGELAEARPYTQAPVLHVDTGPWEPELDHPEPEPGTIGLLMVGGLLARRVAFDGRGRTELLGAGDVIRPWDEDVTSGSLEAAVTWSALTPVSVATLTPRFAAVTGRWPALADELMSRALRRSRSQAMLAAISDVVRVDRRLLIALWHLADRWGRVGPDGVVLPLRLTHERLGDLIGARRPTVTTALRSLVSEGRIARHPDGGWLLAGDPQGALTRDLAGAVSLV